VEVVVENRRRLQIITRQPFTPHLQDIARHVVKAPFLQRRDDHQKIGIAGQKSIRRREVRHDIARRHVVAAVRNRGSLDFFVGDGWKPEFAVDRLDRQRRLAPDMQRFVFADGFRPPSICMSR